MVSDIDILLDNGTQISAGINIAYDAHGKLYLQVTLECVAGSGLVAEQTIVSQLSKQVEAFVRDGTIRTASKYEKTGLAEGKQS